MVRLTRDVWRKTWDFAENIGDLSFFLVQRCNNAPISGVVFFFWGKQSFCSLSCSRGAMTSFVSLSKHRTVTLGAPVAVQAHVIFPCSWPLGYVLQKQGSSNGQAQGGPAVMEMKPLQPAPTTWKDTRLFLSPLKCKMWDHHPSSLLAGGKGLPGPQHPSTLISHPCGMQEKQGVQRSRQCSPKCCTVQGEELNLSFSYVEVSGAFAPMCSLLA